MDKEWDCLAMKATSFLKSVAPTLFRGVQRHEELEEKKVCVLFYLLIYILYLT